MTATAAPQLSAKTRALFDRVLRQCEQIAEMAKEPDEALSRKAGGVSAWGVGQHLEHMAKANGYICMAAIDGALKQPPQNVDKKPKFIAKVVLFTGRLPRGKGKSPEQLHPTAKNSDQARATINGALMFLKKLEGRLGEIDGSPGRSPHPALGCFTAKEWLRFIDIHNRHHFKIIDDIKAAS